MQFNNLSESMAAAVVASWPSPAHLLTVTMTFVFLLGNFYVTNSKLLLLHAGI